MPLAFLTVLVSSALMSYAYAKEEIISTAGVFYALAAFWSIRALAARPWRTWLVPVVVVAAVCISAAWSIRAVGLHLKLRHGAFEARSEWTYILRPETRASWPKDAHTQRVVSRMRDEALLQPTITPALLPHWTEEWWGAD